STRAAATGSSRCRSTAVPSRCAASAGLGIPGRSRKPQTHGALEASSEQLRSGFRKLRDQERARRDATSCDSPKRRPAAKGPKYRFNIKRSLLDEILRFF